VPFFGSYFCTKFCPSSFYYDKDLAIEVDTNTTEYAFSKISTIAQENDLVIYDVAYLELAIRLKASLATFDKALIKVASKLKVSLYFT
jgi:predicted nucleic acid-binding protein